MNIKNRIIGLLLVLITIFTMISPLTPAYAVGGGDGLGNTTSTGGSSSGTWSSSRTGIRVYVVDKNGNLVSNIVDVISNTAIPNYRIIACLGTRGNGTYQSFAAGGLYANGVFNSSTNSGAKVTIISDTTAGLRGKGMPIQTYTSSKFSTHGETLRKNMLGSSGNTWIDDTEVMGGGGGASSTEGAKEFGEFISELNTALIDTFNKQKELGIYSNAELVAYIDKQIISITNQINGVDSETGEALFTDEEKQVIAATLQKFKETALSELNTGTENSSEESLSVDVTNQLFDIAYASETSGNSLHQLYDDGELIRFMDKFIGSIPLFYFNEASGVTQLSVYSETGQESFLLTCAEKGFIIFMEPLFYSRLNKANKAVSEYLFYGTISNYEERTLYVRLRREISEEMVPGDIIIQQSQISKAIHTDDPNIGPRWGNYEFVASIGTFQLTHTAYYSHGCCGSCDPPCGSCHGHTCRLEMPGRNGDNKLNFVFDQINAEQSLQVKTGVHSDTDPKVYIPNGQHPETIGSMYTSDNVYEYVSDGNQKNGAELVTVLWRGGANPTDIPTLAKYKQTDIQNRYGSANWQIPQAMLKNASNTSHKTRATGPSVNSLSITFGIDQGASDLHGTASCVTHNGYNCIYTNTKRVYMIAGTEFDYDFDAQVAVQFYAGTPKGLQAQPFGGPSTTVMKQEDTSGPHYENTIIQGKQQIKFYPYIKMTYMTNSLKLAELEEANTDTYVNKTRYETYVLSEWESSILPSDAVEVGWKNNNEGESLMLTSQQWSLHQKAVNGGQAWNGANQVLPGGAIYQLSTPSNNLTTVDLVTYQTVVDQKTRQYLSSTLSGDEYTEAKVAQDHTDFVNDVKETIDNLRIVQWVRALSEREWKNLQGKPASSIPNAWPVDWAENPGDGSICVRGGGESLNELGLPGVTSSETKYYMHKAAELLDYQSAELKDITKDIMSGSQETASEGDLDIISLSNTTTVFKVFTDTAGNVYMASVSATGTDNEQIITDLVSQLRDVNADTVATGAAGVDAVRLADRTTSGEEINSVLSGDAKQIDDRTKFITNIVG